MPSEFEINAAAEAMVRKATMEGEKLRHWEKWWLYAKVALEAAERMRAMSEDPGDEE